MDYSRRIARALFGLLLFGTGSCCNIQANVGLGPWEAFSMGVGARLGLSFGTVLAGSGLVILAVDLLLREKIGLGTLLDIACIGPIADLLRAAGVIPMMTGFPSGIATLLTGQLLIAVGSYFYIGAGLSCGPRDALMVALCKRFPRTPVGVIRFSIEGGALLTGWLCGAKIGVGTVVAVFGISFILQAVFSLLRFDVSTIEHEDLLATARNLLSPKAPR
ncbi:MULTISPECIES: YczE/YyaS/YitT family protein [unclassified Pyramidobacter]|uniref:YczE/YyaS/YitT family protein n=1 Tax=unclassified Pyramidobacter TaxID=2632171 RepID=UPI00098F1E71|nr:MULTISPECIES: hypothetical protein [unclassified Pyramidobacter]RKJ75869.1 hypothetical protein D7D26_11140 [Pyramidobacter sp. CG50-2]